MGGYNFIGGGGYNGKDPKNQQVKREKSQRKCNRNNVLEKKTVKQKFCRKKTHVYNDCFKFHSRGIKNH